MLNPGLVEGEEARKEEQEGEEEEGGKGADHARPPLESVMDRSSRRSESQAHKRDATTNPERMTAKSGYIRPEGGCPISKPNSCTSYTLRPLGLFFLCFPIFEKSINKNNDINSA